MYKRYEEYKDSGIEWIGEIPEHWSVNKLGYLLEKNDGGVWGDDPKENGVIVLRSTEITLDGRWNTNEPAKRSLSNKEYNNALLEKGDLLLTKSSGSEQHIGKTAIVDNSVADLRCAFSNFMQRLRTKKILFPKYLYYFLNTNGREQLLHLSTTTTGLKNLSGSIINNLKIQAPTINEQHIITTFLNKKTSEIDSLIADKEELIKKLEEYKQSVITEAVTKGLNPDVKMKDSGIEWIEEIPEHWEVSKFKRHIYIQEGPGILAQDFREFGIPLIRISGVKTSYVSLDGCNYLEQEMVEKRWKHFKLEIGDLLISCSASVDMISEVDEEAHGCIPYTGLIRMKPKDDILIKQYLSYYIRSKAYMIQVDQLKAGSTIQHYGPTHIKEFHLLIPSYPEQKLVAEYLDQKTTEIFNIIICISIVR